jgi:F0F1-type ATP synthase membrane subunit a
MEKEYKRVLVHWDRVIFTFLLIVVIITLLIRLLRQVYKNRPRDLVCVFE